MASCILYHGPGARAAAVSYSIRMGRPMRSPVGDDGLKVEAAREVRSLLQSVPVGTQIGTVVIGPMDEGNRDSTDVLLKVLEERDESSVMPVLWARDEGSVPDTVRSRCISEWVPGTVEEDETLTNAAMAAVDCALEKDVAGLLEATKAGLSKGKEKPFLAAVADALAPRISDEASRALWSEIRKVSRRRNPTVTEVVAALLPKEQP